MPRHEAGKPAERLSAEEIAARRAQVYELHLQGASMRAIEASTGIPRATVGDDIKAVVQAATWEATLTLKKSSSARQHAILQEHRRLYYEAARGVQEVRLSDGTVGIAQRDADPELADKLAVTIVSMEAQLAKLEGTNAAVLSRVTVITNDDINRAIEQRREQLRNVDPEHPLLRTVGERPALGTGSGSG